MANIPIVRQGKTNDFNRNPALRQARNFDPGRGRSLQTTEILATRNRKPLSNSKNKFLFISKKRLPDKDNQTIREILKGYLAEKVQEYGGHIHEDTEDAINFIVNQDVQSQKPGHRIAVRPLFSYTERNADDKKCKYGAYKDGPRYRCVQNLNHKKGGGGQVTAQASEDADNGDPDQRTKLQNRPVNVQPYVRKRPVRRADQQDTEPQDGEEEEIEPQVPRSKTKVSSSRELKRLQDYLKDPKTAPTSGKRKR